MDAPTPYRTIAALLAHLTRGLEFGCHQSLYLAELILCRLAEDENVEDSLRTQAAELVETLQCNDFDALTSNWMQAKGIGRIHSTKPTSSYVGAHV